jgi:hypothetical protein
LYRKKREDETWGISRMTSRFCEAFSAISPVRGFGFFETGVALADNALDLGLFCVSDGGGMRRTRLEEGEMG